MALCTHISKIENRYYYRQRIPQHLMCMIPGIKEIRLALGTAEAAIAKARGNILKIYVERFFLKIEAGENVEKAMNELRKQAAEIRALKAQLETVQSLYTDACVENETLMRDKRILELDLAIEKTPENTGIPAPFGLKIPMKPMLLAARNAVSKAEGMATNIQKMDLTPSEIVEVQDISSQLSQLKSDLLNDLQKQQNSNAANEKGQKLFSELYDDFFNTKFAKQIKEEKNTSYMKEHRAAKPAFIKAIGDKPVAEYTRDDVKTYMHLLEQTPKMIGGANKFFADVKGDLRAMIEKNNARSVPFETIDPVTIENTKLTPIKTFFESLVKDGILKNNVAFDVNPVIPEGDDADKRPPFSIEQLQAIFNADMYRGGVASLSKGINKPGTGKLRNSHFWMPLLGLFTGCRSGELGQLLIGEIQEINDMPHFVIQPSLTLEEKKSWGVSDEYLKEFGKTVKTKSGKRIVPVHPELIRIGFMEYVEDMRSKHGNGKRLFHDCFKPAKGKSLSSVYSKRFKTFLDAYEIEKYKKIGSGAVFHSFRHCFKDSLREADISEEIQNRFMGHKDKSVQAVYGSGQLTKTQSKKIELIKYEGLDLSHISYR
jgi:integrase